jgi:beta-lactam-binding protein with PASTA domain
LLPATRQGTSPVGTIISQTPPVNERLPSGEAVQVVPQGEAPIKLASYANRTKLEAEAALSALGLTIVEKSTPSTTQPVGTVVAQNPDGGDVTPGSTVELTVIVPPDPVPMPDIVGKVWDPDAKKRLDDLHIVYNMFPKISGHYVPGQVNWTSITPPATVPTGVPVGVYVEGVQVPNIIGSTVTEAEATLQKAGFQSFLVGSDAVGSEAKKVLGCTPVAGAPAIQGSVIVLSVNPIFLRSKAVLNNRNARPVLPPAQ